MSYLGWGLVAWLLVTLVPLVIVIIIGTTKILVSRRVRVTGNRSSPGLSVEIVIPLKGRLPGQEAVLESLLEQRYTNYHLVFVLESDDDAGNVMVDDLCRRYAHARKVIAGTTDACAQKNHSLIEGVRNLKPDTEVIVFCDSTNAAPPDWLEEFTEPIRSEEAEAVTTFRAFDPRPETLAGVCQAVYASFILILLMIKPKPWGGATGIRRRTFDALNVLEVWSCTVVDDLVLGNVLDEAGVEVRMAPGSLLKSPLAAQTVQGFLAYLDRQILFPKFTNPGIWFASLVVMLSLTMAITAALVLAVVYPLGLVQPVAGWVLYPFLGVFGLTILVLRSINPFSISVTKWVLAFVPLLCLASFVFLRSVFANHIDWHGRRYVPGKGGVVVCTTFHSSGDKIRP